MNNNNSMDPKSDNQGWISLHRNIKNSLFYPKNRAFTNYEAWIDLLLNANHSDQKVLIGAEIYECHRGELLRSQETLAKHLNWSKSKVRRFLKNLTDNGSISLQTDSKISRIIITNYDFYQSNSSQKSDTGYESEMIQKPTQITETLSDQYKDQRPASEPQKTRVRYTNNNDNNENKENNLKDIYMGEFQTQRTIEEEEKEKKGSAEKREKEPTRTISRKFNRLEPCVPPTLEEVREYFRANGYKDHIAKKAFEYYENLRWHDKDGKPVISWQAKLIAVWFKEENEINYQRKDHNAPVIPSFERGSIV
jgi:DNA replication protein DnaD